MIAVFAKDINTAKSDVYFSPSNAFKIVTHQNDIRGRKFSGVIFTYEWNKSEDTNVAYELLVQRQPELFK